MTEEITKLDDKYLVVKREDIKDILDEQDILMLNHFLNQIKLFRKHQGKKDNRYVVLNLDDEIDLLRIDNLFRLSPKRFVKVRDIAVDLVNAILKAKKG